MKVVFLDRDGVINKLVARPDGTLTSPFNIGEFHLMPDVARAIALFKKMNFRPVVLSNQPHYGKEMSHEAHATIIEYVKSLGVDYYMFASHKDSEYYKPNAGMITSHFQDMYPEDTREGSYMIGDRWKDIVPGAVSGLRTIFIGDKYECPDEYKHIRPNLIVKNLYDASLMVWYEHHDDGMA